MVRSVRIQVIGWNDVSVGVGYDSGVGLVWQWVRIAGYIDAGVDVATERV